MNKLQAHFKRMQAMATRYLIPETYRDRDGNESSVAAGSDLPVRNALFVNDMIYMLDGPEQRAAEAELDLEHANLRAMVKDLLTVLHVVDHTITIEDELGRRTVLASELII
jgi:hypothetical protein